jgi:hypothetical protein
MREIIFNKSLNYLPVTKAWLIIKTHGLLYMIIAFSILLSSCYIAPRLPEYNVQPIDNYTNKQSKNGLVIAIRPMTENDEYEKYFGENLRSSNILTVLIVIDNQSSSSVILSNDRISLGHGNISDISNADSNYKEPFSSAAGAIAVTSPLLLPFISMSAAKADEVKHNMLTKEFHSDTLSPGDKTHGFVYFKLKDKDLTSDKWFVHIAALDTATKTWTAFDLPFEWTERE